MTGKADFTEAEWETVSQGPPSAGMIVVTAQRGGTIREIFAIGKAYAEARQQHGESELLDEITSAKPGVDHTRYGSYDELKKNGLQHVRDAVQVLQAKATPEEVDGYRRFVLALAEKVAGPLLSSLQDKRIDGIFAVNESSTSGLLSAMRSQGLRKVHVMGFDSSGPLQRALRDGDVDGLVIQDPYRMGYLGLWTVVKHLEGYDVRAGGPDLPTGEYVATRENIDDPKTREKFDPEFQARAL